MTIEEIAAGMSAEDKALILESQGIDVKKKKAVSAVKGAKRSAVERDWPASGTTVTAKNPWTGEEYEVLVVTNKRRKHGVEFETENGERFHSPSPLCQYLFGKRVSNGWNCICWK